MSDTYTRLADDRDRTAPEVDDVAPLSEDAAHRMDPMDTIIGKLRTVWVQRRFVCKTTAIGIVIAVIVVFLLPKSYQSTTRLMPPDSESGASSMMAAVVRGSVAATGTGSSLPSMVGDFLGMRSTSGLFIGILQSRTVEDNVINKFDLRRVYGVKYMDTARKKLAEHTAIGVDRKSGLISVTVTDRDPQRAAAMARDYVDQLDKLVSGLSTSAAHRERVFLEQRLDVVKKELDTAARLLADFSTKNTTVDFREQAKAMVDSAATLQGQLIAAESELQGLREIYSNNNVRIRSVEARVAELQRQLKVLSGPENGKATAPKEDRLYPSIRELPNLGVRYSELYRQNMIEEAVYETLMKEYELAKVEEAREIPSVKVLDTADVPERKSWPPRLLLILAAACLSFTGAVGWIFGTQKWNSIGNDNAGKVLVQEIAATVRQRGYRFVVQKARFRPPAKGSEVARSQDTPDFPRM